MDSNEYRPPRDVVCPKCGSKAAWRPPARPDENGAWEADFVCENGHRLQLFSKPKRPAAAG